MLMVACLGGVIVGAMPSRNVRKIDVADAYYHVYARGASKQPIFLEPADYEYFVRLFARYLSLEQQRHRTGTIYPHFYGRVELLAYCLMGNHFHLLLYQIEQGAMSKFMQALMVSYGRYFNLKYQRSGSLWESTYKASMITTDAYLMHISRYIHLNPRYWLRYPYSSIGHYLGERPVEWLVTTKITALFQGRKQYKEFLSDYEDYRDVLQNLKHELTDK